MILMIHITLYLAFLLLIVSDKLLYMSVNADRIL